MSRSESVRYFVIQGRRALVASRAQTRLASVGPEQWQGLVAAHYALGASELAGARVLDLAEEATPPAGTLLLDARRLLAGLDRSEARWLLRALHIAQWGRTHRFCGRCGTRNEEVEGEVARRCPLCEHTTFPRISPAVIVLVTREEEILLGRGTHLPPGLFSTLAGFVEPGESLEETVHREIREEVGIEVAQVRYFGSQPWPFPDSLMVGFTAEYAGGELEVDPEEIAEARWFGLEELPPVPPAFSIARDLIDSWVQSRGGDPARVPTWGT